jgi:hypothetical protein
MTTSIASNISSNSNNAYFKHKSNAIKKKKDKMRAEAMKKLKDPNAKRFA